MQIFSFVFSNSSRRSVAIIIIFKQSFQMLSQSRYFCEIQIVIPSFCTIFTIYVPRLYMYLVRFK